MRARKMGRTRGWMKIRDEIQRRKGVCCHVERSAIFGGKSELAGQIIAVFFFATLVSI
jgi:hypothetical protein